MDKESRESSVISPIYGEDMYEHTLPGLIYVDSSFPGVGVDTERLNWKCKGCSCSSHCEAGVCQCLIASEIKSCSDMTLNYADRQYPIFECHSLCGCNSSCVNKLTQNGPRRGLCVVSVGEKGLGVITKLDIPAGSFVCEYAGEIIGDGEAKNRLKLLRDFDPNYILFIREYIRLSTTEQKLQTTIIDPTIAGNIGRYINHSCDPNLRMVPVRWQSMVPNINLFAIRDIRVGEELTYSYNDSCSSPEENAPDEKVFRAAKPCLCFSSKCKMYLPFNHLL